MDQKFLIRGYRDEDFDAVTILWRVAREKLLPEGETDTGHCFYEDQDYFRNQVLKKNRLWVAEINQYPAAFMAMENDFIDQLYVHPQHQRGGIGRAFLELARGRSRAHIWLYTLQSNVNARAFYEKNGFVAEKFGLSPENEPDVEYHWRNP